MKARVFVFALLLLFCACNEVVTEKSGTLYEEATILNTNFNPVHHETQAGLTLIGMGPFGIGTSGAGIRMGPITFSSVEVPEQYYVSFKCQHGQFIIHRKDIYSKLKGKEGQKVKVSYQEIYRTTYEDSDKKKVLSKKLVDFHFIDATL